MLCIYIHIHPIQEALLRADTERYGSSWLVTRAHKATIRAKILAWLRRRRRRSVCCSSRRSDLLRLEFPCTCIYTYARIGECRVDVALS